MRPDLDIVADMIEPGSRVLDLGCGDGALLETLIHQKDCSALGIERDPDGFHACIARGVPVTQGDLEAELPEIDSGAFDVAILSRGEVNRRRRLPTIHDLDAAHAGKTNPIL
jgi:methionine biosynthesis protein MetW